MSDKAVSILGQEKLVQVLSGLSEGFIEKIVTAVEITQAEVASEAQHNHPFTTRTGQLEHSIQPGRIEITGTRVEGEVVADKNYASFVELGTSRSRPFPFLYPALLSRAKAFVNRLRFVTKKYGDFQ